MKPHRWEEVARLYEAALARNEQDRPRFLGEACAADIALRAEVESLLAHERAADRFLESPALKVAAPMMHAEQTAQSLVGRRLGSYAIKSLLGAGGMGEVYRAFDEKLRREVALKILPDLFAADPERLKRVQREAHALAALNHPCIAHIHGLEELNGAPALVMELVEGDELGTIMARGAMPLNEALEIARQIAEALEAAHTQGVVHRDLKPSNIKIRRDGTVKLLDFGLAKAIVSTDGSSPGLSSLGFTVEATGEGRILGTPAYMAPEQAKGRAVDKRADIWAFGVVLFEMLTGGRAFAGDAMADVLAAVIKETPNLDALPAATPVSIRRLIRRCLEKDPRDRLGDMSAARLEIKDALSGDPEGVVRLVSARWHPSLLVVVLVTGAIAAAVLLALNYPRQPAVLPELRADINTPPTTRPQSFVLSPDGQQLVFAAGERGASRLWLRRLESTQAEPLAGTEGATHPFWSPDGRSVAFFASGKLKVLDIGGGEPRPIASVVSPQGGSWSRSGVILYAPTVLDPIWHVKESGGQAAPLTRLAPPGRAAHVFPHFLPDGVRFLFYLRGSVEEQGIYLGSLRTTEIKRLGAADTAGAYLAPGWLLFVRQGALVARRFDTAREELTGEPVTVAQPVAYDSAYNVPSFSASASGALAYRASGGGPERRQLTWFDRSGRPVGTVGGPDDHHLQAPALSPDGRIAVQRNVQGNQDIFVLDGVRMTRLTSNASLESSPVWSPDGDWIAFRSNRKGRFGLYRKRSNNTGNEESLVEEFPSHTQPNDWSRDGTLLFSIDTDLTTSYDLWSVSAGSAGAGRPAVFLNGPSEERGAQFSPNGRWVAYVSNESGQHEVWVRPFPGPGAPELVSTVGGITPRWRKDGQELYYIAPDAALMAASILEKDGTLRAGKPIRLFSTAIVGGGRPYPITHQYAVARDGRFLINVVTGEDAPSPITLILNWRPRP